MSRSRVIYIDVIRVVAMLAVVFAHSCANMLIAGPTTRHWGLANILVTITTVAVPLFYMISGVTILNSERTKNLSYLFKHRLPRILIPFLIWSLLSSIIFKLISGGLSFGSVLNSMLLIYHQPILTAYWFLYPLIGFYLLSPAIKAFVDNVDNNTMNYILIIWFITNIILPNTAKSLPTNSGQYFEVYGLGSLVFLSKMIGYFLLGYKLSHIKASNIRLSINLSIFLIGLIISITDSYIISARQLQDKPLSDILPPFYFQLLSVPYFLYSRNSKINIPNPSIDSLNSLHH
ncbi:acyltransferase [Companilactobacillus allii]|uniref:Acyltransferase 3 domain-containing protein n=1 Tax=Companilactobacillus allii TaxID=1847728 RepID=A0A1P8Q226_9LACO|nr:acyltransferase [Companilactobacillus allii]APX71920.1 hypothetical protein BTM29_04835 [Companilactobacillus allii]USQ69014.1 acyltransferase [Companilactobacillus allii]